MSIQNYLNERFPGLSLRTGIFNSWSYGIRFELGDPTMNDIDHDLYMNQVYLRAVSVFKHLFPLNDEIYLCAYVLNEDSIKIQKVNFFKKYVKTKELLKKLSFTDDYDSEYDLKYKTFCLKCKVSDVKYLNLIKAICNRDMGIKPIIKHDIFFVNINREVILQIYDDRGCDVIYTTKQGLQGVYKDFNNWILQYDRIEIDEKLS
ncbi:DUF3885 domain-containing protein [Paenibacillus sp. FSL K6-1566]|uniref:DUF3885 domain-containing protein n=1 Tax=Paenibacillus sp. FSL K6-1566 TaxID=2954515 RepID=UPI00310198E2